MSSETEGNSTIEVDSAFVQAAPHVLSGIEFMILFYLCAYSQRENPYTSRNELARQLKMSPKTISDSIAELKKLNYIVEIVKSFSAGLTHCRKSHFQVNPDVLRTRPS